MPNLHRGAIGFRLANELQGLLIGIRADGQIVPEEQARVRRWLEDNRPYAHMRPFSELATMLEGMLSDGHFSLEECDDLLFVCEKLTTANPYFDALRAGLQVLMGLLTGVMADRVLTEDEARAVFAWSEDWAHLKGLWPYDECDAIITTMLARGRVVDEPAYFAALARQVPVAGEVDMETGEVPPLLIGGVCAVAPTITFAGKAFVFTGESAKGTRHELADIVADYGGRWADGVRQDTDYLIVCDCGCPHWAFACYGRKVEKAYKMRREGHAVLLVHETDFWDAVEDQR
jgi:hypothetical protein